VNCRHPVVAPLSSCSRAHSVSAKPLVPTSKIVFATLAGDTSISWPPVWATPLTTNWPPAGVPRKSRRSLSGLLSIPAPAPMTACHPKSSRWDSYRAGTSKVKRIGLETLDPLLGALGLKLIVVEGATALERNRLLIAVRFR
jgi:hypothetical protein